MKKIFLIIILSVVSIFPQSAGKSGLSFLKIGTDARTIALGDVSGFNYGSVAGVFYNPALLTGSENAQLLFMHNQWIQDVRSEVGAAKFKMFGLPFAVGINYSTVEGIEVRTKAGEPDATFNANYFAGSIATGFKISENLNFGVTVKYLYENLFTDEAEGFALDFGIVNNTPIENLKTFAVIKNLGSMGNLRKESTKLPVEARAGGIYKFTFSESKIDLQPGLDIQKYFNEDELHINIGAEIIYDKTFALRAGFQSGYESRNLTGGVGINWGSLSFDYALTPFKLGLGSGHSISLLFRF